VSVSPSPTAIAPLPVVERCGPPRVPARTFVLRTADGVQLAAAEVGSGSRGVVLVHELGSRGLCGWWDYAAYLSRRGFHVLLFDHRCTGDSGCPTSSDDGNGLMSDITAAARLLRGHGGRKVVLMGGSRGASEVLIAGAQPSPGVVVWWRCRPTS
jgi:pimeloyl-ACP methyl ester carboxylesterase